MKEGAIDAMVKKENEIVDLTSKFEKSEKFYQQRNEKNLIEINDLKNKVQYMESDEYYNYIEQEILKEIEEDKKELVDQIENLQMQLGFKNIEDNLNNK